LHKHGCISCSQLPPEWHILQIVEDFLFNEEVSLESSLFFAKFGIALIILFKLVLTVAGTASSGQVLDAKPPSKYLK